MGFLKKTLLPKDLRTITESNPITHAHWNVIYGQHPTLLGCLRTSRSSPPAWCRAGTAADAPSGNSEKELLAVLRSDAAPAEKALTCKKLAIYGSSEAVPDLARLLPDPQLSSWSRIALEAIPGGAADEALRTAAYSLQGKLLVGMINSIGVRRDAGAVDLLTTKLQDKDPEVAAAAAVALGHIGNAAATDALRRSLATAAAPVRSAVAEGCVLCAERLLAEKKSADAAQLYDDVRKADVPKQRVLEATRARFWRGSDGIPLLLEQLRSSDKALLQISLVTAREFPGTEVDKALATELASVQPERAALLVQAMADRKESVIVPAVLKAAIEGPKPVRMAAIGALARVGDDSCLSSLLNVALKSRRRPGPSGQGNPRRSAGPEGRYANRCSPSQGRRKDVSAVD